MATILEEKQEADEAHKSGNQKEESTIAPATKGYPAVLKNGVHFSSTNPDAKNIRRHESKFTTTGRK